MNVTDRTTSGALLPALILASALCLLGAPTARAGGDPAADEVATLCAQIAKAKSGEADEALAGALTRIVELHNSSEQPAVRTKIQTALGALLKAKDGGSGRSSAAEALGKLNDPAGAYKALKAGLPDGKRPEVSPYELRALESVGMLAPQTAVGDLAKLLKKGKAQPAVEGAMRALACYGNAGSVRVKVLAELLDAGAGWQAQAAAAEKKHGKEKPSPPPKEGKPGKEPKPAKEPKAKKAPKGEDAIANWTAYAPVLVEALNKLTGKSLGTADEWLALHKDKKTKLDDLFSSGS